MFIESSYGNPYWHTENDTLAQLDMGAVALAAEASWALITEWDKRVEIEEFVKLSSANQNTVRQKGLGPGKL